MSETNVRILVVDDTVHYRRLLSEVVATFEGTDLVGTASRGTLALGKLQHSAADMVLLSLEVPDREGLQTLREICRLHPGTSVIVVGEDNAGCKELAATALSVGALAFIVKPDTQDAEKGRAELRNQIQPLLPSIRIRKNLRGAGANGTPVVQQQGPTLALKPIAAEQTSSEVKVSSREALNPPRSPSLRGLNKPARVDVVAIGISTGGPNALLELIPNLPADLGVPILVVQHMPPVFTASLAEDLAKRSRLDVREAVEGQSIASNVVLIAPGGRHMVVRSRPDSVTGRMERFVGFSNGPPENSCRPSVDTLFRSVAEHYGSNILAVIMTGMGNDGCAGVREMKRNGCYCMTQSEDTCVVYGMPLAVDEAGLSDESVPLDLLASRITSAVKGDFRQ